MPDSVHQYSEKTVSDHTVIRRRDRGCRLSSFKYSLPKRELKTADSERSRNYSNSAIKSDHLAAKLYRHVGAVSLSLAVALPHPLPLSAKHRV